MECSLSCKRWSMILSDLNISNQHMSKKKQHQKSIEQYRRDIFALKSQLKDQELRLQELKQKHQDAQLFGDTTYSYPMRLKILEYNLNDIRAKIKKFSKEEQYQYYCLNFATLALIKSCQVVGITKEMVFRGVDLENKGLVGPFQFSTFLRQVMHLDSQFINPLIKVLGSEEDESQPITKERYQQFLASFMIQSEQSEGQQNYIEQATMRVAKELNKQSVNVELIWSVKQVNIAIVIFGLMKAAKFLDVLDCVACYCRCDPLKSGLIGTSALTTLLKQRINDVTNFESGAVRFNLSKN